MWLSGKESACNAGDTGVMGLIPGSGRSLRRRAWQPTPVFLPGKSHGQRSLPIYGPWSCKDSDTAEASEDAYMSYSAVWTPNTTCILKTMWEFCVNMERLPEHIMVLLKIMNTTNTQGLGLAWELSVSNPYRNGIWLYDQHDKFYQWDKCRLLNKWYWKKE